MILPSKIGNPSLTWSHVLGKSHAYVSSPSDRPPKCRSQSDSSKRFFHASIHSRFVRDVWGRGRLFNFSAHSKKRLAREKRAKVEESHHSSVICIARVNNAHGRTYALPSSHPPYQTSNKNFSSSPVRPPPLICPDDFLLILYS